MHRYRNNHRQTGRVSTGFISLIVVILVLNLFNLIQSGRKPTEPESRIHLLMNDWSFNPDAPQPIPHK